MPLVSGTGCTATALTAAFLASERDSFEAAVHAMALMSAAGEKAAASSAGPGTFQPAFIDALYELSR